MATSKEYPECPGCKRIPYPRITYPTFDHETGKTYYKCHSCGYDSRKEER
jgi:transposase-like protein